MIIDYLANHRSYIQEVADLKYNHWLHTSPNRPYAVWVSEIEDSAQMGDLPCSLVALDESGLLGFVTLIRIGENAGIRDGVWMITLYVKDAHRRKGIGSQLVERCTTETRELGYDTLYLWTESETLTHYYTRRGWQLLGVDEDGEDVMAHKIR